MYHMSDDDKDRCFSSVLSSFGLARSLNQQGSSHIICWFFCWSWVLATWRFTYTIGMSDPHPQEGVHILLMCRVILHHVCWDIVRSVRLNH